MPKTMPTREQMEEANRRLGGAPMGLEDQFGSPLPPEADPEPVAAPQATPVTQNAPVVNPSAQGPFVPPQGVAIERVPEGWSQSSTSGWQAPVREAFGKSLARSQEFGAEAVNQGALADKEQARLEEESAKSRVALDAQAEKEARDRIVADRQAFQDYQARRQTIADEVNRAKVDPDRKWRESSTGAKASAMIAMVLGGIGGGGANNTAVEMFEKMVDRDVEAQRDAIRNKRAGLSDMDNAYAMFLRQGNSEREALEKARLVSRQRILDTFDQSMTGVKNQRALAAAAAATEALEMRQQKGLQALGEAGPRSTSTTQGTYVTKGGAGGLSPEMSEEDRELHIPQLGLFAATKPQADRIKSQFGALDSVVKLANEAKALRKSAAAYIPGTREYGLLAAKQEEAISAFMEARGLKPTKGHQQLVESMWGNWTSPFSSVDARLESIPQDLRTTIFTQTRGLSPYPTSPRGVSGASKPVLGRSKNVQTAEEGEEDEEE